MLDQRGHVAVGMHRHGYDLQLTQYDERDGHGMGANAVAGGSGRRVASVSAEEEGGR